MVYSFLMLQVTSFVAHHFEKYENDKLFVATNAQGRSANN